MKPKITNFMQTKLFLYFLSFWGLISAVVVVRNGGVDKKD